MANKQKVLKKLCEMVACGLLSEENGGLKSCIVDGIRNLNETLFKSLQTEFLPGKFDPPKRNKANKKNHNVTQDKMFLLI